MHYYQHSTVVGFFALKKHTAAAHLRMAHLVSHKYTIVVFQIVSFTILLKITCTVAILDC